MDALFSHDVRNIRVQWVLNETHDFSMSQGGGTHNMPPGWGGTHASWLYVQLQACWMTSWGLSPHLHARCLECNSWCLHMHACMSEGGGTRSIDPVTPGSMPKKRLCSQIAWGWCPQDERMKWSTRDSHELWESNSSRLRTCYFLSWRRHVSCASWHCTIVHLTMLTMSQIRACQTQSTHSVLDAA